MVKTRSSARVGSAAQSSSAENGNPSELRSRLKTTENGHRSQKAYNTSRQVSDPLALASQAVSMNTYSVRICPQLSYCCLLAEVCERKCDSLMHVVLLPVSGF